MELEKVPEFGGFQELLHTFDLLKGKKTNDEEEDSARISGKFKVLLHLILYAFYTHEIDYAAWALLEYCWHRNL